MRSEGSGGMGTLTVSVAGGNSANSDVWMRQGHQGYTWNEGIVPIRKQSGDSSFRVSFHVCILYRVFIFLIFLIR